MIWWWAGALSGEQGKRKPSCLLPWASCPRLRAPSSSYTGRWGSGVPYLGDSRLPAESVAPVITCQACCLGCSRSCCRWAELGLQPTHSVTRLGTAVFAQWLHGRKFPFCSCALPLTTCSFVGFLFRRSLIFPSRCLLP